MNDVEKLRKEAAEKLAEAESIEARTKAYPTLQRFEGRWKKVVYFTKDVNAQVNRFDIRHNCGCCPDSPLEIWPYLETPHGPIYSDPPRFMVGERSRYGGDRPYLKWEAEMQKVGLPEGIIGAVSMHFKQCAEDARESIEAEYGDE
jgi:hypothetical protein